MPGGDLAGLAESHDARHVERAGAQAAFSCPPPWICGATRDPGVALPDVQGADSLRAVDLVGGEGHQVDLQRLHVHRDLAHRLGGVAVEENPLLLADPPDLGERVEGADLVVGRHDGDQDRPLA